MLKLYHRFRHCHLGGRWWSCEAQINLAKAAFEARVKRFYPAEFDVDIRVLWIKQKDTLSTRSRCESILKRKWLKILIWGTLRSLMGSLRINPSPPEYFNLTWENDWYRIRCRRYYFDYNGCHWVRSSSICHVALYELDSDRLFAYTVYFRSYREIYAAAENTFGYKKHVTYNSTESTYVFEEEQKAAGNMVMYKTTSFELWDLAAPSWREAIMQIILSWRWLLSRKWLRCIFQSRRENRGYWGFR